MSRICPGSPVAAIRPSAPSPLRLGAADHDGADRASLAHEGNGQCAAKPPGKRASLVRKIRVLEYVRNRDDAAGQDGAGGCDVAARRSGKKSTNGIRAFRVHDSDGCNVEQLAVERRDGGGDGTA